MRQRGKGKMDVPALTHPKKNFHGLKKSATKPWDNPLYRNSYLKPRDIQFMRSELKKLRNQNPTFTPSSSPVTVQEDSIDLIIIDQDEDGQKQNDFIDVLNDYPSSDEDAEGRGDLDGTDGDSFIDILH